MRRGKGQYTRDYDDKESAMFCFSRPFSTFTTNLPSFFCTIIGPPESPCVNVCTKIVLVVICSVVHENQTDQTGISSAPFVARAEHVFGDFVERQEERPLAALFT